MDAATQRPIVIGGEDGKWAILGIRYLLLVLANMTRFLIPVFPQTDEEIEIVKRWLRAHGYPSYKNWSAYCETMHRSLAEPVIEQRVVVLEGEIVDDEPRSLPASRERRFLPSAGVSIVELSRK